MRRMMLVTIVIQHLVLMVVIRLSDGVVTALCSHSCEKKVGRCSIKCDSQSKVLVDNKELPNKSDSCEVPNFTTACTAYNCTPMQHITPAPCSVDTTTITVTSSGEVPHTNNYTEPSSATLCTVMSTLVGLLVILLAVVTTGWVWTCWTIKKRKAKPTHDNPDCVDTYNATSHAASPTQRSTQYSHIGPQYEEIPLQNEIQDIEPREQTDRMEVREECGGCDNYNVLNRQQSQSDQHLTTIGRGVAMGVASTEVGGGYWTMHIEMEGNGQSSPTPSLEESSRHTYHVLETNKESSTNTELSTSETLV